ncbi:MAG: serine/threonine-protein kinase, partial [Planctomycetota bacterium]
MPEEKGNARRQTSDPEACLHLYPQLKEELQALFNKLEERGTREFAGECLGDFKILREIGFGGMATVYEAIQISLNRKVALKILPSYKSYSNRAVKKFLREAEAGGRQCHPGIVAIYAVGEYDKVHFIAQELVGDGFTLNHSIEQLREAGELPQGYFRKTARLFIEIADALQHAHEAGVIHCDMKPSNILLTPDGKPKVSDFGMARVEGALVLTRSRDFSGTPCYMSPEQATGQRTDVDHRSDVYSLGVTLFEALTLTRPFDGPNSHEVLKKIIYDEPPAPRKINPRVPRDLAIICLKAMDKDPSRRYPGMAELSEDLERFLNGEDIAARPAAWSTRMVRTIRRNPALSGLVLITVVSLLTLLGYVIWSYPQILRERDRAMVARAQAEKEAEKARAVNRFMQGMVISPQPGIKGRDVKMADLLDRAAEEAHRALADQPEIRASLLCTLGGTFYNLGLYKEAREQYRNASEILEPVLGAEHPETLNASSHLATTLAALNELHESEVLFNHVIEIQERVLGREEPATLKSKHNLATTLIHKGDLEQAISLLGQVIESRRRVLGEEDLDTLASLNNLATLYLDMGRFAEAEESLRGILRIREHILGEEHPQTIGAYVNLTNALTEQQRFEEAESLARKSMALCRKVMGNDHPKTFMAECTL